MTTAKIMAVLLVLALVGSVSARVITVEVTGIVDEVWTDNGLTLDDSVSIGSVMTGFTTYDTETPDLFPEVQDDGEYQLISISMTVGNYTFMNDPMFPEAAVFRVGVAANFSYMAGSIAPRFDGTIYINSSPKTSDEVDLDTFGLSVLSLGGWNYYGITDALPDSFMDLSVYSYRSFGVGSSPDHIGPGFYISGELTSLTVIPEPATTYYVDAVEGNDNNDGLSPQTAFATIQKAIDSAFDGDTVLVADGTYTGQGNRDIDFLGKAITVRSESGPENCMIDCNGTNTDHHRGFYFHSGEDANSVLDGFKITNGYARQGGGIYCRESSPTITNCTISGNSARGGGGIFCWDGSPTITNCTISGNSARAGGGIFCWDGSPTINNCIINSNTATGRPGGGAILCAASSPTITNCTISGNSAEHGGGILCMHDSGPTITNCTISGNSAVYFGGGITCYDNSNPTITNCIITDNSAEDADGGGISCMRDSSPTITNCTITGNWGGIASRWGSSPIINNCTITGNSFEGIYCSRDSSLIINNSILWANTPFQIREDGASINVRYTDVQGGWEGESNMDEDPCFVEPGYWDDNGTPDDTSDDFWIDGDYHLLRTSPCVDAGTDANVYTDIEGSVRPFDFPGVDNNGDLPEFDMGAYELVPIEAAMKLTPQMLNCNSKGKYIKAHLTLPEEFSPADVDVNEPAIAEPMNIYSEYIKVLGAGTGLVKLEISFDREAFCETITETGEIEITVIGSLTTSRYFYATDTIKIKP